MLDQKHVDWETFHTSLIQAISDNRATNKTNQYTRSRNHSDQKEQLYHQLARAFPSFVSDAGDRKKQQWTCAIDSLAAEFARLLENRIVKGGGDQTEEINNIFEGNWKPRNQDHEETIYYVSGFAIRTVHNRSKDRKEVAHLLKQLEQNASTTKEDAEAAGLPIGKVERMEAVSLYYTNNQFYEVMQTIESVFDSLLSEKNIAKFGTMMIDDIIHYLSKEDLGLSQLQYVYESSTDLCPSVHISK